MSTIWTIRRSATDTKLTGLCGGVARHWRVDPVLVRLGFVLLTLSGGIGLVLYVAGWLLIPVDTQTRSPVDDFFGSGGRRWPKEVWVAGVAIACVAVFTVFGSISPFGVGPALVLAVVWYFGFYRNRAAKRAATLPPPPAPLAPVAPQFVSYPGPPTPFTEAADAWRRRIEENARQAVGVPEPAPTSPAHPASPAIAYAWPSPPSAAYRSPVMDPPPTEPAFDPAVADHQAYLAQPDPVGLYAEPEAAAAPQPGRRGSSPAAKRLRLVSLIVLGLVLGGLGLVDGRGVAVPLVGYLGAALLVVGLTLVVATWFGRARGLLPVGLLLAVSVAATSVGGPTAQLHDLGSNTVAYTSLSAIPAGGDQQDVGQLKVDLSRLPVDADATYAAHVDLGSLQVVVPPQTRVVVRYQVDQGAVRAYGQPVASGSELEAVIDPPAGQTGEHTLTLDLSVELGELVITQ